MTARVTTGSPYAGLRHYTESDAAFFFGREAERDIVNANLLAARLTLLYGESGVGKSSLLHAGVARTLRELSDEAGSSDDPRLAVVVFDEWSEPDPVRALLARAAAEISRLVPGADRLDLGSSDLGAGLAELGDRLGGEVLVILDQFEESFLYHGDDGRPGSIAAELPRALRRDDLGANFLISIREDQLARLDRFKGRIPNLFDNYLRVEHLDREAAREAVVRPIEELNRIQGPGVEPFRVEPELAERVLTELEAGKVVVGSRGAGVVEGGGRDASRIETPYLQLVLSRLWDEERRVGSRTLRAATLASLGGAEAIVRRHLDEALEILGAQEQAAAARLFHYLVTPSGTKIAHRRADLAAYAGLGEDQAARLLERLAGEMRILRPVGEDGYEIYHDALAAPVLDWRARVQLRELERERRSRRRWRSLASALAAAAIGLGAYAGDFLARPELDTLDLRFAVRGDRSPPAGLILVAIDDATFTDLQKQWPFPRSDHGRLLDRLREAGVRAVAYDIQFSEPTEAREDSALIDAVERLRGRVALVTTEVDQSGNARVFGGDDVLDEIGARAGNGLLAPDEDGVLRRLTYDVGGLESFGLVAAELATGRPIDRSQVTRALIDFAGKPGTITTISFSSVLRGTFDRELVRGRIAVVGAVAPSLQDLHTTAVGTQMSGPEAQANVIETALKRFPLRSAPAALGVVTIVVLGLVPVFASRLRPLRAFGAAIGVGVLYAVVAQVAFLLGIAVLVVYPLLGLVVAAVLALAVELGSRSYDQPGSSSVPTPSATRLT